MKTGCAGGFHLETRAVMREEELLCSVWTCVELEGPQRPRGGWALRPDSLKPGQRGPGCGEEGIGSKASEGRSVPRC